MRLSPVPACLAVLLALVSASAQAHDHQVLRGRLVFADHEKAAVRVLDLDTGEVTHEFDAPRPNPGLAGLPGGRFVVVKTGDEAGTIRFLDTGLTLESHGDHVDVEKGEVRMLDFAVTGDRPAHVVAGHGQLALFYDGMRPWERRSEPRAVLVALKALETKTPATDIWPSPAPQHGIVVPLGDRQWLMSMPNPIYAKGEDRSASSRPNGFEVLERRKDGWRRLASFNDPAKADASCRLFHGHGAVGTAHVFGCAEGGGMLVVEKPGKSRWSARKIAYPDGRRTSTIKARAGARHMVGNYGLKGPYDALLRIDPSAIAATMADVLPVPGGQPACQFELSANGRRLANLTPDGVLRIYEIAPAWRELAAFEAAPAFDCQYGAKTPTPGLAIVGASAFVSDPTNGRIREYGVDSLKQGLDMPVGGMPANLAGGGGD